MDIKEAIKSIYDELERYEVPASDAIMNAMHVIETSPNLDTSSLLTGHIDKPLTNKCRDCIFRVQFAQIGVIEDHVLNICYSEYRNPGFDGAEELLEVSNFNADRCLNYVKDREEMDNGA
jgi:hypothetical protein